MKYKLQKMVAWCKNVRLLKRPPITWFKNLSFDSKNPKYTELGSVMIKKRNVIQRSDMVKRRFFSYAFADLLFFLSVLRPKLIVFQMIKELKILNIVSLILYYFY